MSKPWVEIVEITRNRQTADHWIKRLQMDVRDRVNGPSVDYVIPYWEEDVSEDELDPMTPMLITEAVDWTALQAASHLPNIFCPARTAYRSSGKRSTEYAHYRRKTLEGTWFDSRMEILIRRYYRHMTAYASGAMIALPPDSRNPLVGIRLRDPLTAYPDPRAAEDQIDPLDAAFIYGKSATWIRQNFPQSRAEYDGGIIPARDGSDEIIWDMLEWVDHDEIVLGIAGPREGQWKGRSWTENYEQTIMELGREPNRIGYFPGFVSNRVTLDKAIPHIANILPAYDLQSKLLRLHLYAVQKSIEPDKAITGQSMQPPKLDGGEWSPGHTGEVNVILDGEVQLLRTTPDPTNLQMVNMLERNVRISTGLVPQAGGETYGALRTGRGLDTLTGIATDPRILELHEIAEAHLRTLNSVVLDTYKAYSAGKTISMFSGSAIDYAEFDFKPSEHVETNKNVVKYPIKGADTERVNMALGQLSQLGAISDRTLRRLHPWVSDSDGEERQLMMEGLEKAAFSGLQQMATQNPVLPAFVYKYLAETDSIFDAIEKAHKDLQELQDKQLEAEESSEAQPGLAGPPQAQLALPPGAQQPPEAEMQQVLAAIASQGGAPSATPG